MSQPFHCPNCSSKLPVTTAFKLKQDSRINCPNCGTKIRPDQKKRSLMGASAGGFLVAITLVVGHVYLFVRYSEPLPTYAAMIGTAALVFVFFSIITAKKVVFERVPEE